MGRGKEDGAGKEGEKKQEERKCKEAEVQ